MEGKPELSRPAAGAGRAGGRKHGTRARYVQGPDRNGQPGRGCRCTACTTANRSAAARRQRLIAYGQWEPFVDAEPVRQHVRMLASYGIGWRQMVRLTGVSGTVIKKLLWSGPGGRPPTQRIRPGTAAALLAVQPSLEALGGAAYIDATGTRRRLQALIAVGWSQAKLAARLGILHSNFCPMLRQDHVRATTARAVRVLYDELWDKAPPASAHREKISVSRARNYARARGWPPPAGWDDDTIDDPAAGPADGWQRPKRLSSPDLAAEARELFREGLSVRQAAERLGVSQAALEKALQRTHGAAA